MVKDGSMAELANAIVFHPKDPGLNLGITRIFSYFVCVILEFKLLRIIC
jgi:hypothetical protein